MTIAPGIVHWHGAAPDSLFTHLAITPGTSQGVADWFEPVTNEDCRAAHEQIIPPK